jgi:hypothetical protein
MRIPYSYFHWKEQSCGESELFSQVSNHTMWDKSCAVHLMWTKFLVSQQFLFLCLCVRIVVWNNFNFLFSPHLKVPHIHGPADTSFYENFATCQMSDKRFLIFIIYFQFKLDCPTMRCSLEKISSLQVGSNLEFCLNRIHSKYL